MAWIHERGRATWDETDTSFEASVTRSIELENTYAVLVHVGQGKAEGTYECYTTNSFNAVKDPQHSILCTCEMCLDLKKGLPTNGKNV